MDARIRCKIVKELSRVRNKAFWNPSSKKLSRKKRQGMVGPKVDQPHPITSGNTPPRPPESGLPSSVTVETEGFLGLAFIDLVLVVDTGDPLAGPPHESVAPHMDANFSSPLVDGMIGFTTGGIFAGDLGAASTLGPHALVSPHIGITFPELSSSVSEDAV